MMTVSKIVMTMTVSITMMMLAVRIVMMIPMKDEKDGYLSISTAAACEVGLEKGEGVLNCAVPGFFLAICVYIVCNCCIHVYILVPWVSF